MDFGRSSPIFMRPGVVSTIRVIILPEGPTSMMRPLILVCSVITPAASAWSISAMLPKSLPSPGSLPRIIDR